MSRQPGWQAWTEAAATLADCLERENQALERTDYVAATAFAQDKRRALDALVDAQAAMGSAPAPAAPTLAAPCREAASRLEALAQENRRLLTRAIAVQSRVIDCFARAMRGAAPPPRYAASGGLANARSVSPVAFMARA